MSKLIDGRYKYYAFISYNREDEQWAKWLQHKLEHYRLPTKLNNRIDLPRDIRPVFKDTSELSPGNLSEQIHDALESSKYLIVICSPRSSRSEWVNKEISTFLSMGRIANVIPFIIEGREFASDPYEECFPPALRQLPQEQEILGANINEMGRDAAAVKVVAKMFDLRFDELWRRYEREQKRRRNMILVSLVALVLAIAGVALWMYQQKEETQRANWRMMENQARMVAEKSKDEVKRGNTYDAILALLELIPGDGSRPFVPELEEALRTAYDSLCSRRWNIKYFDKSYNYVSFADDDEYIVCKDKFEVELLETKNLHRIMKFNVPDNLQGSPSFLSSACDSIFFMDTLCLVSYHLPDGKFIGKMDYSEAVLDRCMNACSQLVGYSCFAEWKKDKGVPDDALFLDYNPQRQLLLYQLDKEDPSGMSMQSRLYLYDCRTKQAVKVIDDKGTPFSWNHWNYVTSTFFSPDGSKLAIAYVSGTGEIIDLNDFSSKYFDCGDDCGHYSNYLSFGRNGQLFHTSMYDSFKIYDGETLMLVDSIPSFFSDGKSGEINTTGDVCLIGDVDECMVYFLNKKEQRRDINGEFKIIETSSEIYEDTIIDHRFHIQNDEDGALCFDDLEGEYKPWNRRDNRKFLEVKGYFQDDKYMAVAIEGFRGAQDGVDIIDIRTGTIIYQFSQDCFVDCIYYNDSSEQLAIGDREGPAEEPIIDFPRFENLLRLCKTATEGMELSRRARRLFYLD